LGEKNSPTVDVLIPVTNEPKHIILNTVTKVLVMKYPHTVYLLDDGDSKYVEEVARDLGAIYIKRPAHVRKFAKSGNLNYALTQCKGDFLLSLMQTMHQQNILLMNFFPF